MLRALRHKDPYTYGHCHRVGRGARLLAKAAGLNKFEQRIVELSGLFHDIGKIAILDSILLKEGRLTPDEEHAMREHPLKSVEILTPLMKIPFFKATLPGIRHHHERIDGYGYPDHLPGEQIPLTARIVTIADTFDAMTSSRPYRKALSQDVAYREIRAHSGRQFDAQLAKIFLETHSTWGTEEKEMTPDFVAQTFKKAA